MKLDPTALRYLGRDEFRVLTAVEMGQKNHDIVPRELIVEIADLRNGGTEKLIMTLLRHKLLHHECRQFDGYRLTTLGYDFLALRAFTTKNVLTGVGRQIGVGKESDIFLVQNDNEEEFVLKIHRLGRTSFRKIKTKRDYHGSRGSPSWLYLSRLAAHKEFLYMTALWKAGFPTPRPIDWNRHCIVMSLLEGYPLHTVTDMEAPEQCARTMLELILRLGEHGLIHGDFNEFNVAVDKTDSSKIVMYDFPQMISIDHANAEEYFDRDVRGVTRFFELRFGVRLDNVPTFDMMLARLAARHGEGRLDKEIHASGFSRKEITEFERVTHEMLVHRDEVGGGGGGGEGNSESSLSSSQQSNDDDDDMAAEAEQDEDDEDEQITEQDDTIMAPSIVVSRWTQKAAATSARVVTDGDGSGISTNHGISDRAKREVKKRVKKESKGGKTTRNIIKSRDKRKMTESMRDEG